MLTRGGAQALQDAANARGGWLIWMVSDADPAHPGQAVARAHALDQAGGTYLPGALVAGTLDELRAMLPTGLTRTDRTPLLPPGVIEMWD